MCAMHQLHLLPPVPNPLHSLRLRNGSSPSNTTRVALTANNCCCHRRSDIPCQIGTRFLWTVQFTSVLARPFTHQKHEVHRSSVLKNLYRWRPTLRGRHQLVLATASASGSGGSAGNGEQLPMPSASTTQIGLGDNVRRPAVYEASSSLAVQSSLPFQTRLQHLAPVDQAFLLLGFIACVTTGVLTMVLMTAIPTLNALRRAAVAIEKLAEVAREELPSTMAAIRLSGMEISDLTLELNDLSHEISDGVKSSARAAQAAEIGMRHMGALAATQTISMLQERANVPVEAVKPAMLSAAQRTRQAMELTQKMVVTLVSHPRLAGWLGQLIARKEKSSPEVIPEVALKSTDAAAPDLPLVEEITLAEEKDPESFDVTSAQN